MTHVRGMASPINALGQYATDHNRAYCYAEIAVSSPAVTVTIASTQTGPPQPIEAEGWPG